MGRERESQQQSEQEEEQNWGYGHEITGCADRCNMLSCESRRASEKPRFLLSSPARAGFIFLACWVFGVVSSTGWQSRGQSLKVEISRFKFQISRFKFSRLPHLFPLVVYTVSSNSRGAPWHAICSQVTTIVWDIKLENGLLRFRF